ncbi:citrate lyase holo-[acyl-carrier protein] synthase [Acerihabitans sp. KWT182]|uniref:Apo-citrate lyase phosphoribosyl-dephospho-CoA transferase n=1 Tax=Acerihabitans sp. KWT182 TaxID=3157919 RepID=A0AAU7QFE6_9GAMM
MALIDFPGPGVTLDALLAAKERRAARQSAWLGRYGLPLLSLTLVTPGPVKDSLRYRQLMAEALNACGRMLADRGWPVAAWQAFWLPTGPEAFYSVDGEAAQIKAAAVALEQRHPLGRLWDMDVLSVHGGLIGRKALGQAGRRCLVCHRPAHVCGRSRRHPLPEVMMKIEALLEAHLVGDES